MFDQTKVKLNKQRTMGHKLRIVTHPTARFQYGGMCNFAGCDSKVHIKGEIVAMIFLDIHVHVLAENGKRENR